MDDEISRLIFKFQTGGLETRMASTPRISVSFLNLFFVLFTQPKEGQTQKINYRNNCRGNQHFLSFTFVFLWSHIHSGWLVNNDALERDLNTRGTIVCFKSRYDTSIVEVSFVSVECTRVHTITVQIVLRNCTRSAVLL